jgi:mutator family transposase
MKVFTDLKSRGCQDILIAVTDGLKGMSEALAAIYPMTTLQTCIGHLLRHSLHRAEDVECTGAWTLPYCGRRERAHSDLENRPERGFPPRPHAQSSTRPTQKT